MTGMQAPDSGLAGKVALVTGGGRGIGRAIVERLAGDGVDVVFFYRGNAEAAREVVSAVTSAGGKAEAMQVDIADAAAVAAAVEQVITGRGRIDVLVNNAGSFKAGFFEEISPEDFRAQIETTLFGPVNLTRVVLPVMRAQRSGLVVTISSTAGVSAAGDFMTAYAASKFGVEGFMESLTSEVAPFGIRTMLVEPGFFRTELLSPQSTQYAVPSIADYAERTTATVEAWKGMDGQQGGDPAKLADALIHLAGQDEPPLRFVAGADAVEAVEGKARLLLAQADAHRELASSLAHDDA
jgi:NAD(P)-dependent dehydrogenase (short-subunit alcohol dehydrogenase family)